MSRIMDFDHGGHLISHEVRRCPGCNRPFCDFYADVMEGALPPDFLSDVDDGLRVECRMRKQADEYVEEE